MVSFGFGTRFNFIFTLISFKHFNLNKKHFFCLAEDFQAEYAALNDQLAKSRNHFKSIKTNIALKSRAIAEIATQCEDIEKDLEEMNRSR